MKAETRCFDLPAGRPWVAAVVADTHSQPHARIAEHLAARRPDVIFHCGDIGDLAVLEQLGALAPTIAVRGNNDAHAPGVPDALTVELKSGAQTALRIWMTHIAVYGPRLRAEVRKHALQAGANLVLCGHSHVPFISRDGALTVFNPGSIGPRRFTLPITFGVITLADRRVGIEHVDCETGQKWLPPAPPRAAR